MQDPELYFVDHVYHWRGFGAGHARTAHQQQCVALLWAFLRSPQFFATVIPYAAPLLAL
jgi:hypothetical protein